MSKCEVLTLRLRLKVAGTQGDAPELVDDELFTKGQLGMDPPKSCKTNLTSHTVAQPLQVYGEFTLPAISVKG
jgi:hypothetical protein